MLTKEYKACKRCNSKTNETTIFSMLMGLCKKCYKKRKKMSKTPYTRDEINNALLESEIRKQARQDLLDEILLELPEEKDLEVINSTPLAEGLDIGHNQCLKEVRKIIEDKKGKNENI